MKMDYEENSARYFQGDQRRPFVKWTQTNQLFRETFIVLSDLKNKNTRKVRTWSFASLFENLPGVHYGFASPTQLLTVDILCYTQNKALDCVSL